MVSIINQLYIPLNPHFPMVSIINQLYIPLNPHFPMVSIINQLYIPLNPHFPMVSIINQLYIPLNPHFPMVSIINQLYIPLNPHFPMVSPGFLSVHSSLGHHLGPRLQADGFAESTPKKQLILSHSWIVPTKTAKNGGLTWKK